MPYEDPDLYNPTQASRDKVIDEYKDIPDSIKEEMYRRFREDFIVGGYSKSIDCI